MTHLSLFSGGGGSEWTAILLGWTTVGYVEQDSYCQKILRARIKDGIFHDAPIFNDVRSFDGQQYRGRVDIISAGFPCQPFSVAGNREGAKDKRNMWPDTIRIIRQVKPRQLLLENVSGLLSSGYFGTILRDLAASGYDARWKVLSAAEVGAPHKRDRLWIYAYADDNGLSAAEVSRGSTKGSDDSATKQITTRKPSRLCVERSSLADANGGRKLQSEGREQEQWDGTSDGGEDDESNVWWSAEPELGRVANGVANRSDRIRALGNGWVPAVAVSAWKILAKSQ